VFSGPFLLDKWVKDADIALVRNAGYWCGAPYLDGISWQVVTDSAVERARMAAGSVDLIAIAPEYLGAIEQLSGVTILRFLRTDYDYIRLQQGDPVDPQPRLNDDGSVNENHGVHPVLGKKEVRQALFFAKYDVPGGGFNFRSFYRPDYEALESEAKTVAGYSYAERGAIYRETQEILYDEQPYVWLYTPYAIYVFNDRIGGMQPGPWDVIHDIQHWYAKP
jgi:ABC-type transport system substrate-binding protein